MLGGRFLLTAGRGAEKNMVIASAGLVSFHYPLLLERIQRSDANA